MSTPVRFPFGVSTSVKGTPFGDYRAPSPLVYHEDFDDFNRFAAAEWTITRVGSTPTEALQDGAGGWLRLTTVASASSSSYLQKVGASFEAAAGKQMFFATRFKVSHATDSIVQAGLILTDTTPLDATDGIWFVKATGAATVQAICRKNATTGSVATSALGSVVADTFCRLAFWYDGKRTLHTWFNDTARRLDLSSDPAAFLPDTLLRVSFGLANGASTARNADFDYIYAAVER